MKKKRGGSSWRRQQSLDPSFQAAKRLGYRCRASLKLLEMQQKARIFNKGDFVLDLGAAPGGWSQVAQELVGKKRVIGVDLLPILPLEGIQFIQGDLRDSGLFDQVKNLQPDSGFSLVISDMAPNISGIRFKDQAESLLLAQLAFDFAANMLSERGRFLVKLFQGPDVISFTKDITPHFTSVRWIKPKSSRADSSEVYFLGESFLG